MTFISSLSLFNSGKKGIADLQESITTISQQISSGKKASLFSDISAGGNLDVVFSLQTELDVANDYTVNNVSIIDRLEAYDLVLSNLIDIASSMRNTLVQRNSSSGGVMNLQQIVKNDLANIQSQLNTQYGGRYLFSGSRTDTPPVSNIETNSNLVNDVIVVNYYSGDNIVIAAQVSDSLNIPYGITANSPIFANLIAAANQMIAADISNQQDDLQKADRMVTKAIADLSQIRSINGNNWKVVEDINTTLLETNIYLTQNLSNLTDTDIVEASKDLIAYQTNLQAAYAAFAKISRLSLNDYLN